MPDTERFRWVSKASLSYPNAWILSHSIELSGRYPAKLLILRSRRRRDVRLKMEGSKPLLDNPRLLRSSTVTLPVDLSQPTPSQRQQSVPWRHDRSLLMVDVPKEKDFFSCRSASAWFGWHRKGAAGRSVRLPP